MFYHGLCCLNVLLAARLTRTDFRFSQPNQPLQQSELRRCEHANAQVLDDARSKRTNAQFLPLRQSELIRCERTNAQVLEDARPKRTNAQILEKHVVHVCVWMGVSNYILHYMYIYTYFSSAWANTNMH